MSADVTVASAVRLTGVTYRQLDYWVRNGYLRPDNNAQGSGCPRDWPDRELRVARAMGKLVRAGIKLGVASRVARASVEDHLQRVDLGSGVAIELVDA